MTLPAAPYTIHHTIQKDTNIMFNMDLLTYSRIQYNTLEYIKLRYSIEPPNKYLYCTVLFRTVLYKKRENLLTTRQGTSVSKTEVHSTRVGQLKSTLSSLDPFRIHEGVGQ